MTTTGETGPWYFAWVGATDTTFSETFARVDEWVYSVDIEHREGDNPTATLEIENPGVGLLAAGREQWMWISFRKANGDLVPLFFGRLTTIPSDLIGTVIRVVLVARAINQELLKLAQAQLLRVSPYSDIWVDRSRQNNPDSVLEVYSSRWHFDRVDLSVSTSDILEGEDGTFVFLDSDVFYDGMTQTIDNVPLTSFTVIGEVGWTQRKKGSTLCVPMNILSYTGDGLISDWPKANSDLGSGWRVGTSEAKDILSIGTMTTFTGGFSIQNKKQQHNEGDLVTANESWTRPSRMTDGMKTFELSRKTQMTVGFSSMAFVTNDDPNHPVSQGGPGSVVNYPGSAPSASVNITYTYIPRWNVSLAAQFLYDQFRRRREAVIATVTSDLQPAMAPAGQPRAKTETLKLTAPDVGLPLWATVTVVASGNVSDGDTFEIEGTPIYTFQTTLTAGVGHIHIGATAAISLTNLVNAINANGVGTTGVDFSVECSPNETIFASVIDATSVLLKTIAQIAEDEKVLVAVDSSVLVVKSPNSFSLSGSSNVSNGDTVTVSGVVYTFDADLQIELNQTNLYQTIFQQVPYHVQIGGSLDSSLSNLAAAINDGGGVGSAYGMGTYQNPSAEALESNGVITVFPRHANAVVTVSESSASVSWSNTSSVMVPDKTSIPIVDVSHGDFFPTDNGILALESILARPRARLRFSSRAVSCSFEFPFELGLDLNCRMNATVPSPRLFGGSCTGKIVQYNLKCSGDTGEQIAVVKIGSAIGNAVVLDSPDIGTPTYVDDDYGDVGYQEYEGGEEVVPTGDLNYSPPLADPRTGFYPSIISDVVDGDYISQEDTLTLFHEEELSHTYSPDQNLLQVVDEHQAEVQKDIEILLKHKVVRTIILSANPVPMDNAYTIETSVLSIPKQTDLGAV